MKSKLLSQKTKSQQLKTIILFLVFNFIITSFYAQNVQPNQHAIGCDSLLHDGQEADEHEKKAANEAYYKRLAKQITVTSKMCDPTNITPYIQVGGSWGSSRTSVTVEIGTSVKFGPQAGSGGTWRWSGPNGFTSNSREATVSGAINTNQAGTYIATFTNACGTASTASFVIKVNPGIDTYNLFALAPEKDLVTIDMLMLYSHRVSDQHGDEAARRRTLDEFTRTNDALANSGATFRLRLVGLQKIQTPVWADQFEALRELRDFAPAQNLRKERGADAIYYVGIESGCGVAYVRASKYNMVGVSVWGCGANAMRHEFGHNMSLRHGTSDVNHGNGYNLGWSPERTCMGGNSIPYFSTPNRTSPTTGNVIGFEDKVDGVRAMNEFAPTVAAYFDSVVEEGDPITGQSPNPDPEPDPDPVVVDGGSVSSSNDQTEITVVTNDGAADNITFKNTSTSSEAYIYLITDAEDKILTTENSSHDFEGSPAGICKVYGLSYKGSLSINGKDINDPSLVNGDFDVSDNSIIVKRIDEVVNPDPDPDPDPSCTDGVINGDETGVDCGGEFCAPCETQTYCEGNSLNTAEEYIGKVHLGTIENVTKGKREGYGDYTSISTTLSKGVSHTINITPKWRSKKYEEAYGAWIDYNGDGDFNDAGELVWSKAVSSDASVSGSFMVPASAKIGATRLRVVMRFENTASPCGPFNYGEVEDYTVIIK